MKSRHYIQVLPALLALAFLTEVLHAQDSTVIWTQRTAQTISKGKIRWALFQSSAYGLTPRMELDIHPLLFFEYPHAKLRIAYSKKKDILIASEHGFRYPTPFLKLLKRKGTGGFISPQFRIPFLLAIYNGFIASRPLGNKTMVSAKAGFEFALKSSTLDRNSSIDLPLIYPRLAPFYDDFMLETGLDITGPIYKSIGYDIQTDQFFSFKTNERLFLEHGIFATYTKRMKLRVEAGIKLCYGRYPFGSQWHLLPALDFQF